MFILTNNRYIRFFFDAGTGMSPSSSNDKMGACIRSYFVCVGRVGIASADRLINLS